MIVVPVPPNWTVAVDEDGKELGRWPDLMRQVQEGNLFYIGQVAWVVAHIDYEENDEHMTVYLRKF